LAAAGADEVVLARTHAVEVAERTLTDARTRLEAGAVNRVEVTRALAALERARQQRIDANATRDQVRRALATLLGVKASVKAVPPALPAAPSAPASVAEALARRPEVRAAERSAAAASAAGSAAAWRWSPTLGGFGTLHGQNYVGFSGDRYAWAAGVELDWSFYDGGVRDADRHRADAQRREAEARLSLARDTIGDEVANAEEQLAARRSALEAARRQFELQTETLDLVRVQHDAGTATQLDLLTAQDALVTAEVGLAQARFDLQLGDLALLRAQGTFPQRSAR
jgi:outer membrane protein TolC